MKKDLNDYPLSVWDDKKVCAMAEIIVACHEIECDKEEREDDRP